MNCSACAAATPYLIQNETGDNRLLRVWLVTQSQHVFS
jgi:hypothetical protein